MNIKNFFKWFTSDYRIIFFPNVTDEYEYVVQSNRRFRWVYWQGFQTLIEAQRYVRTLEEKEHIKKKKGGVI